MSEKVEAFLTELSDLIDKHGVAICSQSDGRHTKVAFTLTDKTDDEVWKQWRFTNNRSHSTGYEIRCRISQIIKSATYVEL